MEVRFKKLRENALAPTKAYRGDAGFDLYVSTKTYDDDGCVVYGSGLAFEIPEGYVGYLFMRSSISKKDLHLTDAVGVIDSGYRGEVTGKFKPMPFYASDPMHDTGLNYDFVVLPDGLNQQLHGYESRVAEYHIGDAFAQLIIMELPKVELVEADELSESERGNNGFGSSNKK